jgi:hypothetical protein
MYDHVFRSSDCLTLGVTVNKDAVTASTAYPQELLPGLEQL